MLGEGTGEFSLAVGKKFDPMVRIVVRVEGPEEASRAVHATIHGRGPKGQFRTERLDQTDFQWFWHLGTATSESAFASIDRVVVKGLSEDFESRISIVDHRRPDLTQLLPLWAAELSRDRSTSLIDKVLLSCEFWRPMGLSACSASDPSYAPAEHPETCGVRMLWNEVLGEALLAAGRREEAGELVTRLLEAASSTLQREGSFRAVYDPEAHGGAGERDSVFGVAPLNLFLQVLGLRLIGPWSLELSGRNPFPWPVTVRWRGLTVRRPLEGPTVITFPDGRQAELAGEAPRRVDGRR